MAFNVKDHFYREAKRQQFQARSVFKLDEMDRRFDLVRPGQMILDLGAAPGSWSQYCSRKIGRNGLIIGIDLKEIKITLPNAKFYRHGIEDLETIENLPKAFDLVLSDMAPATTGIRVTDQARSYELCQLALDTAKGKLKPGGSFVCKLFHSEEFEKLRDELRTHFKKVEVLRPKSTRKQSKEIFFICKNFSLPA